MEDRKNNVKYYKIVKGYKRIKDILKRDGTPLKDDEIYNYCSGTIVIKDHHLIIGGHVELSVNYIEGQLEKHSKKDKPIKLEEIENADKKSK